MSVFSKELKKRQPPSENRRWIFVPYDQLTGTLGPLSIEDPGGLGIVVVENPWKAARRPYHKQKLALILANLRHFALEQAARGVAVRHVVADGPYHTALEPLIPELGRLRVMVPAERELRMDLKGLEATGGLEVVPHEGWLTREDQLAASHPKAPPWRMDAFYRRVRQETGILMKGRKPVGGKYSFDPENRLSWKGHPPAPDPPRFPKDPIKDEVGRLIEASFKGHPGRMDLNRLPATGRDAEMLWSWAKKGCLPLFGPYEDAMSVRSSGLFHTRISALLNLLRLTPARVIADVLEMDIPLQSKEGFVRQVLGWREFVNHVHRHTDGFRDLPEGAPSTVSTPGDAGFGRWAGRKWRSGRKHKGLDGGAAPSALGSDALLPSAYWGDPSGLACLDHAVTQVWEEGYGHHITRLMILSNLATLLDVSPRELTDWFWAAYMDAFDWVVEPNVLGMGTFALGELMTTKPYVSGAAYINRMSDYCPRCPFDPKSTCPVTPLYWAFLRRHQRVLRANPRLRMPYASLKKRAPAQKTRDRKTYEKVREILSLGGRITPHHLQ
jgi:deoxyribodipyrimidine photolyase-related protein